MRTSANFVTLLLLFCYFAAPSTAEIKSVKIRSDDGGRILLDYFKFTNTGQVSITVSSISLTSMPVTSNISQPDPSLFGFYLLSDEAHFRFNYEHKWSNISCSLHSKFITLLFTFQDLANYSSFNKSYPVTYPNGYSLYFCNCNPLSHLTMDVRTELYNIENGCTKDYLSAGMTKLPRLYFTFSIIYLCFLGFWMFVCFMNHKSCYMIHLLMGVLLATKAINLYFEAEVQHSLKVTGTRSHGWDISYYIFQFIARAFLYTVITVISDGSSFGKPRAKWSLIIVLPIQVWLTILLKNLTVAGVGVGDDIGGYVLGLTMLQSLLLVTLMMPIGHSLCSLGDTDEIEQGCRKDSPKFGLCSCFFILVGVYLFTDIVLGTMNSVYVSFDWKSFEAEEIISLVFYILMFLMFMPFEKNAYFDQHNEAAAVKEVEI